jgi:hypothetical protein
MKFNLNALKNTFKTLSKSPVDDLVKASAKSNVDDVALGALDIVDDIPNPIDVDDFEAWRKRTLEESPPIPPLTNDEILENLTTSDGADGFPTLLDLYNAGYKFDSTPDYRAMSLKPGAMRISPKRFGQKKHLIDSMDYPDGFIDPEDFARYYDSLELGFIPAEFADFDGTYIHPIKAPHWRDEINAGKILNMQDRLGLPTSPKTIEQSKMLAKKYLNPEDNFFLDCYPMYTRRISELYHKILNS